MKKISIPFSFAIISFLALNAHPAFGTIGNLDTQHDPHSYANYYSIRVQHINLSLTVDFTSQQLIGNVELTIHKQQKDGQNLILDSRDLNISAINLQIENDQWKPLDYHFGSTDAALGTPLIIQLTPFAVGESKTIRINYKTNPNASGLQWLTPTQTRSKKHPFLFTQSQPIHARSWIPLQDTPAVRFTYHATIRVPENLKAVMSANNNHETKASGDYYFSMPQAIPSYLMALAVGQLDFKSLGNRSGIYAEPDMLNKAATEFEDIEKMLATAEKLYGPYRWGRYDLLILPPSFPFGGMENPRLSFITPTVIAGDKSLVSLVAHELAHSWSGNLVSNASWEDLWLNEGFTTYVETRIMEALYGSERVAMESVLYYADLLKDMEKYSSDRQILAADLNKRDPGEAFNNITYIKGLFFLIFLEKQFGRKRFDAFLQQYFDHFAFQSIDTEQFMHYLKQHLLDKHPKVVSWKAIQKWVYAPGLPKNLPVPVSQAFREVELQQEKWLNQKLTASQINYRNWVTHQWLHFLNHLPKNLSSQQLQELDNAFNFSHSTNSEIAHSWLLIVIQHHYKPAYPSLQEYLISIGRSRLIIPLYKALIKNQKDREFALITYRKARPGYHPQVTTSLDKILSWDNSKKP